MSAEINNSNDGENSVRTIIKKLKDGTLSGKMLDKETRQEVVDTLRLDGESIADIAETLGISDRTIKRDVEVIRKKNAHKVSASFSSEMIGELVRKGAQHWQAMKSIAKDPSAKINEKLMAERMAWEIELSLSRELRELGALPSAPKALVGKISHQVNISADSTWEEIFQQYLELKELIANENGIVDVALLQKLNAIEPVIQEGLAKQKVQEIINEQKKLKDETRGQG